MKQQIKRIADRLFSFSKPQNDSSLGKTEAKTDTPVMTAQIFPSNVLRGTNPDLPLKTACQGSSPETPAQSRRDQRVRIRFTPEELAEVKKKAAEAGLDCSKYIRAKLNAAEVTPAPAADVTALRAEVNRIGVHIDDIRARAHVMDFIDAPELHKALNEHHTACQKILAAFLGRESECHE